MVEIIKTRSFAKTAFQAEHPIKGAVYVRPFRGLENRLEHGCFAGIFEGGIEGVFDEIEKRLQVRIAEFPGGLSDVTRKFIEKRKDFVGGDGVQFPFAELASERMTTNSYFFSVFFWNWRNDTG